MSTIYSLDGGCDVSGVAQTIPGLLVTMQRCTKPGGYTDCCGNVIRRTFPVRWGFPFAFKEGELRRYYEGWDMLKYNEDVVGELHRTDENGKSYQTALCYDAGARKNGLSASSCKSRCVRHFCRALLSNCAAVTILVHPE